MTLDVLVGPRFETYIGWGVALNYSCISWTEAVHIYGA